MNIAQLCEFNLLKEKVTRVEDTPKEIDKAIKKMSKLIDDINARMKVIEDQHQSTLELIQHLKYKIDGRVYKK